MSDTPRHEVTLRKLVYTMPGVDAVTVRRDVPYRTAESGALGMDVYYPAGPERTRPTVLPAVVVATGFSDAGGRKMLGCVMKEMESYIGWARLVAASGMVAVMYENREPMADLRRRCLPPRRFTAAFGAKSGAPTCIRRYGVRRSRSIRTSTWPAARPAICGCSKPPASALSC